MADPEPISLVGAQQNELFPTTATAEEMMYWLPAPISPIWDSLPRPTTLQFNDGQQYTTARSGPFASPWPDDRDNTLAREGFYFLVNHGDRPLFDEKDPTTFGGVAPAIATAVMQNGVPINHWAWTINNDNNPDFTRPWERKVKRFVNQTNNDARSAMVTAARQVWDHINPRPRDLWHLQARTPGRLVQIMLYLLRINPHQTPKMVRHLIGHRLRSHFDIDALYTAALANQPHMVTDPNDNQQVDLVPILRDWLEVSCAHILVEVFRNHYLINPPTRDSTTALRDNFKEISKRYPHRDVLLHNLAEFPYK